MENRESRVAVYIRWSTEDQSEGTTLDIQRDACRSFLASQGWQYDETLLFIDDGVSGATMERPALRRLRSAVSQGQVDCVVVYKLDRLSRSVLDMLKLVLEEWDGRCAVKSAREPIDTLTPTGKMFFYQLMSFAEWERAVIRDRMFAGRLRRAHEGRSPGFVLPYGYRKGAGGQIEHDPAAAPVVERIFQLYVSGPGFRLIARKLDSEGIPGPAGGRWDDGTLSRILGNPAYAGRFVYGRTRRVKGHKVAADQPHLVRDGFFPAIVGADLWEAAQRTRAGRPGVGRGARPIHGRSMAGGGLLSGLIRCAACGRAMAAIAPRLRGVEYRYYACSTCPGSNIRQEELDGVVAGQIQTLAANLALQSRLRRHLACTAQHQQRRATAALDAARQELRRQQESERRLKGLFLDGKLGLDEYRSLQAEASARLAAAESRLSAAEAAATSPDPHPCEVEAPAAWDALPLLARKQVLRHLLQQIAAHKDPATGEVTCAVDWRLEA